MSYNNNGVWSLNFIKIHNPIPTVIFVHGSKIKTRHEGQDRSAICSISKQRGHLRTECPELPKIQEMLDKDRSPEDPDPPEMRSWEQARKFIELREIQKKEEQKKKEWERKEQERLKRLEEKEQHRRDMLSRMSRRPAPRRRKQKDDGQHSADTDSDTRGYSDGEGFELVKQRGFKKRRTNQKKGLTVPGTSKGRAVPETSKEPPVTQPKQTKFP